MFSKTKHLWARNAHAVESYFKLVALALLATSFFVACGKNDSNGAVAGVSILSVNSGGVNTSGYTGTANLTVSVGDNSGAQAQTYVLNVQAGAITGDLRLIGQNVYELQATCANVNCSDVAFMIIARRGFTNTTGTFNSYLGTTSLNGNGVIYPYSATSGYTLTTQPLGSIEYLYREQANGTGGVLWQPIKSLIDNTGTLSVLTPTQIQALEAP